MEKRAIILVVVNQKGGVGKTGTTVNLSRALAKLDRRTLIVDNDPQGQSGQIYIMDKFLEPNIRDLYLHKDMDIHNAIRPAELRATGATIDNLFVIHSNIYLAATAETLVSKLHREERLLNHLKTIRHEFDFIVIDSSPSLNILNVNAIVAADFILIPCEFSGDSLEGIADLFETIGEAKENDQYRYGILMNKFDSRKSETNRLIDSQLENLKEHVLKSVIRQCEPINKAQLHKMPVFDFEPNCNATEDYMTLAKELING